MNKIPVGLPSFHSMIYKMKYSYYLGGSFLRAPVFHSLRSTNARFRTSRRLQTSRGGKVTYFSSHTCSMNPYRFCPRRQASTDSRKSQMAVVGTPPKVTVMPPNPVEINMIMSSVSGKRRSNRSVFPVSSPKRPQNFQTSMTYGEFLAISSSCSNNDQFMIESVFLPTFHSFQEEFHHMFGSLHVFSADPKVSSTEEPSEEDKRDHSERSSSWDELPWVSTDTRPLQSPESGGREVKKGTVLPRELKYQSSQERLQMFFDIHSFDEPDAKNDVDKKDIGGSPLGSGNIPLPTGQLIIHSDRSSFIINKDLYITNRILDKLKKREKEPSTAGEPPEPIVKHSSVSEDTGDLTLSPLLNEIDEESHVNLPLKTLTELVTRPAHKSKSDTDVPSSIWFCLNPAPKERPVMTKNPVSLHDQSVDDTPFENEGIPFKEMSKCYSGSAIPSSVENKLDFNDAPRFASNVEFRNPPVERLSPLEFKAFQSRKNLYKRLLRNTPCYLVDGLHIQNGTPKDLNDIPTFTEHCFNKGDSGEISNTTYLPSEVDETVLWELPIRSTEMHRNDCKYDQVCEEPIEDLEEWFVPLGKEIDSMLTTLSVAKSINSPEITLNRDSQKQMSVLEDRMDFKDCLDHIGDAENFSVAGEHFENGMIPFEGLEDIESSLSNSNCDPSTPGSGLARFSSDSTTQKPPTIPPKQNNPNVDIKTETTIKCCRSGDNTDINVIETQRYLDKRLPYPFSTETVLQVYGTKDSLYKATQAVENSKSQLVHLSNANTPNPGMTIPKLQFNHMLSKTHELTNLNPNNKKRVFKIKIVPESGSQYSSSPNVSSIEPISHIMHVPKHPTNDGSREVADLQKKSKFSHRMASKKLRRSESAKQLRSRKKHTVEDVEENITVLSPKDLERMFPAPPKPKPVEKPRNVTVNSQAANTKTQYNSLNLVESSNAVGKITLKAKKTKDQWFLVKKKTDPAKPNDSEARRKLQASVKVEKETSAKKLVKNSSEAGLSSRDQKILKTIISHKVKDSFNAVSQREKLKNETAPAETESQVKKSSVPVSQQPKSAGQKINQRAADKLVESKRLPSPTREKNPFDIRDSVISPPTRYEQPKVAKKPRREFDDPLAIVIGRQPVSEKLPKKEAPKCENSPTPIQNREHVSVSVTKVDHEKVSRVSTKPRTPETPKHPTRFGEDKKSIVIRPTMGSVLPLSQKGIVDIITKNTPGRTDDSSEPKTSVSSGKQVARSNAEKISHSNKPSVNSMQGDVKSKFVDSSKWEEQEIQTRSHAILQRTGKSGFRPRVDKSPQQPKKEWQRTTEPTFFPFETPTVKELDLDISTHQGKLFPPSPLSSDTKSYEADFCKLGAESYPGLDAFAQAQCKVPLSRVKEFPMINESKMSYSAPKMVISVKPNTDLMLRRTLSQMPAVTKVLGATLSAKSQQALDRWKEGLVSTIGEEGFQKFVENQLRQGSHFHSTVGKFLLNKMDCKGDLCMKSMSHVFPHITDVGVIESQVVHPQLAYRGVVDCVAKYKGKPVAIEWKRSDKSKSSIKHTYDAPLQLSAYIGAMNFDNNYKLQVDGGLVVVAYSDGSPADVFDIPLEECQNYWSKWLKRLHKFYSRS